MAYERRGMGLEPGQPPPPTSVPGAEGRPVILNAPTGVAELAVRRWEQRGIEQSASVLDPAIILVAALVGGGIGLLALRRRRSSQNPRHKSAPLDREYLDRVLACVGKEKGGIGSFMYGYAFQSSIRRCMSIASKQDRDKLRRALAKLERAGELRSFTVETETRPRRGGRLKGKEKMYCLPEDY